MVNNKKKRRHSGRVTPAPTKPFNKTELIANALEPQEHYSDWDDLRDGLRDTRNTGHLYRFNKRCLDGRDPINKQNKRLKKKEMIRRKKQKKKRRLKKN